MSIKRLFGKERVVEVMDDLKAAARGSSEPEAGWFDLFSSRYWKGIPLFTMQFYQKFTYNDLVKVVSLNTYLELTFIIVHIPT